MRIMDTKARSYWNKAFTKIMDAQEKGEKDKYLVSLHAQRKDFTPLVYTGNSIVCREAQSAGKSLASLFLEKWRG